MEATQDNRRQPKVGTSAVVCDGLEWPDQPGLWTRDGEEWTAKRTADGQMWIIPPDPEDGCVPRMLADLAQPPVLGRWFRSHTDQALPTEGAAQDP